MEGVKEVAVYLLGLIMAVFGWVFRRQIKRIDDLEVKVKEIDGELKLNSERDKHMEEAVDEIKKGQKETQNLLNSFLQKYSFILDKELKKAMEE